MLTSNIFQNMEEHQELSRSHADLSSLQASNKALLQTLRQDLLYIAGDPGQYESKQDEIALFEASYAQNQAVLKELEVALKTNEERREYLKSLLIRPYL